MQMLQSQRNLGQVKGGGPFSEYPLPTQLEEEFSTCTKIHYDE
jgi:hypothetical protein